MTIIKKSFAPIISTSDEEDVQSFEYEDEYLSCESCGKKFVKSKNFYKKVCLCKLEKIENKN